MLVSTRHTCPHCMGVLDNTIEKPYNTPVERDRVHLHGRKFLRQIAVAMVVGECEKHGLVKTETLREQI